MDPKCRKNVVRCRRNDRSVSNIGGVNREVMYINTVYEPPVHITCRILSMGNMQYKPHSIQESVLYPLVEKGNQVARKIKKLLVLNKPKKIKKEQMSVT